MKKVTRTIETHVITPAEVKVENGQIVTTELPTVSVSNQGINEEKALKLVQKEYGKTKQYVILKIETSATTYGIDFDKFMELAEIIEK